jgi:hypothetical protein
MSVFRFSNNLTFSREDREELVIVTSKQYLAVAHDFLRKLFPEITPDRFPYPRRFTVVIADNVVD